MSPLNLLVTRTIPELKTEIVGTIVRFGMSKANEFYNHFVFQVEGYDETFEITLSALHECHRIGLIAAGDRIRATGAIKDGRIKDCLIEVEAGRHRIHLRAWLSVHA